MNKNRPASGSGDSHGTGMVVSSLMASLPICSEGESFGNFPSPHNTVKDTWNGGVDHSQSRLLSPCSLC